MTVISPPALVLDKAPEKLLQAFPTSAQLKPSLPVLATTLLTFSARAGPGFRMATSRPARVASDSVIFPMEVSYRRIASRSGGGMQSPSLGRPALVQGIAAGGGAFGADIVVVAVVAVGDQLPA